MLYEGMTRAFGQYAALQQEHWAWTTQANKVENDVRKSQIVFWCIYYKF